MSLAGINFVQSLLLLVAVSIPMGWTWTRLMCSTEMEARPIESQRGP